MPQYRKTDRPDGNRNSQSLTISTGVRSLSVYRVIGSPGVDPPDNDAEVIAVFVLAGVPAPYRRGFDELARLRCRLTQRDHGATPERNFAQNQLWQPVFWTGGNRA